LKVIRFSGLTRAATWKSTSSVVFFFVEPFVVLQVER
jgi:hypothetical protein